MCTLSAFKTFTVEQKTAAGIQAAHKMPGLMPKLDFLQTENSKYSVQYCINMWVMSQSSSKSVFWGAMYASLREHVYQEYECDLKFVSGVCSLSLWTLGP